METQKFWKITDFAEKITKDMQEKYDSDQEGVHYNTVDKWFKSLESRGIHYISRIAGEKVYDEDDLAIGHFIYERRREKFALKAIYDNLHKYFDLRPMPAGMQFDESHMMNPSMEQQMRELIYEEMNEWKERMMVTMKEIASAEIKDFKNLLPKPEDQEEEKTDYIATSLKVSMELEKKAIEEWNKLPESERMKKVGWFKKEEDYYKREYFIREYKQKHMQEAILAALHNKE